MVGLAGHSLNHQLEEYLQNWTEPDTPADQLELPRPWLLKERLSAEELVELIARYQAGATSRELARDLGISKTALVRLLRMHGVQIRGRGAPANSLA